MKRTSVFLLAFTMFAGIALVTPTVYAQSQQQKAVAAAPPMSSGEVTKVDKDAARIGIKHGPLVNLNMPGMTMTFKVEDAVMLNRVMTGDKINFTAEKVNGALTVTKLEPLK
jgi:Cu(I)/Ag(I) efflux system protein CusF